jgi:mono/diheme cytochrome c family protein
VTEAPASFQGEEEPTFAIVSYPVRPPSSAKGKVLYEEHCAECHGPEGAGGVPGSRNFQDVDYMRGETPADFYVAVTEGRATMPAYNQILTSDQRWDVVFYVWRLATTREQIEAGAEVYAEHCAQCHGEAGGGELLGSADFTDLRQMAQIAPRDLYLTITQGRGSMPAMQSVLSQEKRWQVIEYLLTFTYDPELAAGRGDSTAQPDTPAPEPGTAEACSEDQSNPFAWDDESVIEAGGEIYQQQCAGCHGGEGKGGLPNTPDFTSLQFAEELRQKAGKSYCALERGVGAMPGFREELPPAQIWQVLTYLSSLGQ